MILYLLGLHHNFVLVHVDDTLITCDSLDFINSLKCMLRKQFALKDLGLLKKILGIEVNYAKDGSIHLSQRKYIQDLLAKANMDKAKSVSTPIHINSRCSTVSHHYSAKNCIFN